MLLYYLKIVFYLKLNFKLKINPQHARSKTWNKFCKSEKIFQNHLVTMYITYNLSLNCPKSK